MTEKNLLLMFKPGDEKHYHLKNFVDSLSRGSKIVLNSAGYQYDWGMSRGFDNLYGDGIKKRFTIIKTPTTEGLDKTYFNTNSEVAIEEIRDEMRFRLIIYDKGTELRDAKGGVENRWEGTIEQMVQLYDTYRNKTTGEILIETLKDSEELKKRITKRKKLGLSGNRKLRSEVLIGYGIETLDEKYVVTYAGFGPFRGGHYPKEFFITEEKVKA